jgi:hypothetical protein
MIVAAVSQEVTSLTEFLQVAVVFAAESLALLSLKEWQVWTSTLPVMGRSGSLA